MENSNVTRVITLLWFSINIGMVGLVFTSFFVGGRVPLGICIAGPIVPAVNTTTPSLSPTPKPLNTTAPSLSPTVTNYTYSPSVATFTPTQTKSPTPIPNNTDGGDGSDDGTLFYDDANAGFIVMWSTFLLVVTSVVGTMILKSSRTPFAIGLFAGVVTLMANLMFLLAAQSAGELRRRALLGVDNATDQAILAFSIIEFMLLSAFAIVLIKHKDEVMEIGKGSTIEEADAHVVHGARGI
jgi:hypothetical protein